MAAGGGQTPRPHHPVDQAAARPAAGPGAHPQLPAPRAVRSSLGPRGPAVAAPASLPWWWGTGPRAWAPSPDAWIVNGRRRLGSPGERVARGGAAVSRSRCRSGPVYGSAAAPEMAPGRSRLRARHGGAQRTPQGPLARRTAKQALTRPGSPPLARYRARKQWLKCSRDLGSHVALSRTFALSRGLARPPGGAEGREEGPEGVVARLPQWCRGAGARGLVGFRCVRSTRSFPYLWKSRVPDPSRTFLNPMPRPFIDSWFPAI